MLVTYQQTISNGMVFCNFAKDKFIDEYTSYNYKRR